MSLLSLLSKEPYKADLRQEVLRDLQWLLNATTALESFFEGEDLPYHVQNSVLNYGLPPFAGATRHKFHQNYIQQQIQQAIIRFEPRLLAESIEVTAHEKAPDAAGGVVSFEIRAFLKTLYGLEDLAIVSKIDLDSGEVTLIEV